MVNYGKIIDRHYQYTEMMKRIINGGNLPGEIYPSVTVSRDPGSGGRDVAKNLAKKLGIKYLDKKRLMNRIVKKAGVSPKLVEKALNEETISGWQSIINSFLGIKSLNDMTFIRTLIEVLLEAVTKEPVVILGRGANFILPVEATLRVRITAPRRVLIKYAMQFENQDRMKARQEIDKYMKDRHDFVYKYFSRKVDKAHYYDLCLSTEFLSINQATEIAHKAFKQKFGIR
jgi:cytidylate kinase